MTYNNVAELVLEQSEVPMGIDEIWNKACELGYDKKLEEVLNGKISKTPIASLAARMYSDIKYNPDTTIFIKTGKGKFFLKSRINILNQNLLETDGGENYLNQEPLKTYTAESALIQELSEICDDENDSSLNTITTYSNKEIKESYLHIPLTRYLDKMKIFSKTINANSINAVQKGKMKWGTPDIVGVTFKDYINKSVLELFDNINIPTTEIYAYELKLELTLGSLTENYFQALSNSGWANESYLVAAKIDENNYDLMEEMRRLNQSFGVGIIHLNYENPEDSEIIFSAKKRAYLDIDTMDKLCINNQFKDFIDDVNKLLKYSHDDKGIFINGLINEGRLNNPN